MGLRKTSFLPGFASLSAGGSHGGELSRGRRKTYRPIDPKQALHLVLRSSKARGRLSMLHPRNCGSIHALAHRTAGRWGVRIYRFANVGNHLHLLIKVPSRMAFQRFLKELAGGLAILVTGAKKGAALEPNASHRGFWDHLAYTRIVSFGKDFRGVARYLIKNVFESAGVPMRRLLRQGYRMLSIEKDGTLTGAPP